MRDANSSKRSQTNSDVDENSPKLALDSSNKTEKTKRKRLRKRRGSSSPEEDIIDGFVIASYSSLRGIEVSSHTEECPSKLDKEQIEVPKEGLNRVQNTEQDFPRPTNENIKGPSVVKEKDKHANVVESSNDEVTEIESSRQSPGQMTDNSSDSGNSGKGYICDGESEDEQVLENKKPKTTFITPVIEPKKEVIPIKVDLSKDVDETVKKEKPFQLCFDSQKTRVISSPKPSSFHSPSLSFSSSLTISQSSRVIPQNSWLPRLSSSLQKPLSVIEPCCGSTNYSGPDALHQELNNRFLQSHSEMEQNAQHSKPAAREMHQHSHLHHHQHQHTHYYPSPLLAAPYYPPHTPAVVSRRGVIASPFSSPVPTYSSHMLPQHNKKTGKWCAAHVHVAWKIYCHQRGRGDMSKDLFGKHEFPMNKPSSTVIPPYPSHQVNSSDFGFHSSHLRSGSSFGKPPPLIGRSSNSNTAVTSCISAFSSVSSTATRRTTSPVVITTSRASSISEISGKQSPNNGGPSTLYPWLKSEPKTPELDLEKSNVHAKREFQSRSPTRPSNFSIQALAGERSEIVRPSSLVDLTRSHSSREHRPCDTRTFMDSPLVPNLASYDKRPIDYRLSSGSIDLNRNSLYSRFEPMHTLYSHHVPPPLTSHLTPYHYPGPPLITEYHPPPGMVLTTRDPMTSLVRAPDSPFYMRHHDLDDRMSGRH